MTGFSGPERSTRAFLDRCRRLPAEAQALLLTVAADDSGRLSIIRPAAARLVPATRPSTPRSAPDWCGPAATTCTCGRPGSGDLARRTGLDNAVAGDLDAVAERATRRGGHEAASAASERAAELSSSAGARAYRRFAAANSAWPASDGARARALALALADEARYASDDPVLRADIDSLRGRIEWHIGSPQTGLRIILNAARDVAGTDPSRALGMRMAVTALATWGSGASSDEDLDFAPPALADTAPARLRCSAALLHGHRHFLRHEMGAAAAAWREAFGIAEALSPGADLLVNLGIGAMHLGDVEIARRSYDGLLTLARDGGSVTTTVHALSRLPAGRPARFRPASGARPPRRRTRPWSLPAASGRCR